MNTRVSQDKISSDLRELVAMIDEQDADAVAHGVLGGEHGYGAEFENDVFEMHPYWWDDCTCGHEQREWDWGDQNKHTPECYQSKIDWDAPDKERAAQISRLCAEMGLDPVMGSWVHCTCYRRNAWRKWMEENPHPAECPVVRPNFLHKETGFEVRWYKYIGRSMDYEEISRDGWRRIFRSCEDSLLTQRGATGR